MGLTGAAGAQSALEEGLVRDEGPLDRVAVRENLLRPGNLRGPVVFGQAQLFG